MGGYDTIVVGAGSAGSVVARRLADAGQRVLVLEAGGPDTNPAIHDPGRAGELWHGAEDWDYYTVPQPHAAGRRLHLPRGKVLGGSHALNAMIWVRGAAADYDGWALAGNDGWSWDDVLPVFKDIEDWDGGASELRGAGGLLDVISRYPLHPIQAAILQAGQQLGLALNPDYNGARQDGIGVEQVTIRAGERLNTYQAYLAPAVAEGRIELRTGCWIHRLLAADSRVVGVEYEQDGSLAHESADEVVLCAGTLDSPRILLRSGIGPADQLRGLGIDVTADLPGVGENLHDHLLSAVIFATDARELPPLERGMSVTQTHWFWRSRDGLAVPDTQPINFSVPMYEPWMSGPATGFSLMAGMISPKSRGALRLTSADPHQRVAIDLNALAHPDDLASLEASVRQCRELGAQPALADAWGARELYPGPDVADDDGLRDYVRRTAITYHHQVGTCAMGVGDDAVVTPRLRVRGLEGIRVADASVMPTITTGNTNAPAVMIAERAARFALAE